MIQKPYALHKLQLRVFGHQSLSGRTYRQYKFGDQIHVTLAYVGF
jgi:hypothetical protein